MKIYISGKISGLHEDDYYCNFGMSGEELYTLYPNAFVISPLEITPLFGIKKWLFFMVNDIRELKECTHIAIQKNWKRSMGAFIELFVATFILKIQVIELKHECIESVFQNQETI